MKSGLWTTEFWLTILSNIVSIVGSLAGVIPPEIAAIIVGICNAVYAILRTLLKRGGVSTVSTITSTPSALNTSGSISPTVVSRVSTNPTP